MCGAKLPYATQLATGLGVHELVADVLANEGRLHTRLWEDNYRYILKKSVCQVALVVTKESLHEGQSAMPQCQMDTTETTLDMGPIEALTSCMGVFTCVHEKSDLKITRDVKSSPGLVFS